MTQQCDEGVDDVATENARTDDWVHATQSHYDPDDSRSLPVVVIKAIADAEEVPITDITTPPLYQVVDIDGIENSLFGPAGRTQNGTGSTVEFQYNEYKISIEASGRVTVFRSTRSSAARSA